MKLSMLIFAPTEQLSRTLQGKDTTVQEARNAALVTEAYLRRQRTDAAFEHFYRDVITASEGITDEPVLPRRRKPPARFDDGAPSFHPSTPEDLYRVKYFEALDVVCQEIKTQFGQKDLEIIAKVESLLLNSANGLALAIPEDITTMYKADVEIERLGLQLRMLPDVIQQYNASFAGIPIKKVTSVRTIGDVLNSCGKQLLSQVHILVQLYFTIPVTTATSERTFSTLRRLKTYLRTSMCQDRLNHLLILYCHKSRTDAIDLLKLASDFVSANEKRSEYFGAI